MADPQLKDKVEELIREHKVLLLMKGTPEQPRCGFSMRTVGVLDQMGVEYAALDVLPALQPLREVTSEISDWQTFPQLYVKGELVGGCDIVEEMLDSGELAEVLGVEQPDSDVPEAERILPGGSHQMLAKHRGLAITPEQRFRFASLMSLAADDAGLPDDPDFRSASVAYVEWGTRLAMHNSQPGAEVFEHAPVPRWGWGEAPPFEP